MSNYWHGFIHESKRFMAYDSMTRREKFRFWWVFPRKACFFYIALPLKDIAKAGRMRKIWQINFFGPKCPQWRCDWCGKRQTNEVAAKSKHGGICCSAKCAEEYDRNYAA